MKRITAALLAFLLLIPCFGSADSSLGEYEEVYRPIREAADVYQFDKVIELMKAVKDEHPEIYDEKICDTIIEYSQEAAEAMTGMNSEFDEFDNAWYYWFGDQRTADEEHIMVPVINQDGCVVLFFFPVKDHIGINDYVAIYDCEGEHMRIEGQVEGYDFDNIESLLYESFYIKTDEYGPAMTTLAFRFYGENKQIDYTPTDEERENFNRLYTIADNSWAIYHKIGDDWWALIRDYVKALNE